MILRNPKAKVTDPNKFVSDPGSPIHQLYSAKVLPNGKVDLLESGQEDIQQLIDSYRDSTDMAYILHQLAIGNDAVLHVKKGMYGDFTKAPRSLAEAQQMMIDGEAAFYQLPTDIRSKFNNDWLEWLHTAGSDAWEKNMVPVSELQSMEGSVEHVSEDVKEK